MKSKPLRLRAHHYATGELLDLHCEQGRIARLAPADEDGVDIEADWVAPALFDLQINGCDGISFNSPHLTEDDIRRVVAVCRRHGIGALCPTLITNSHEALLHGFAAIQRACAGGADLARALPALHLEGPYISAEDGPRGAHPLCHVRPPDWDEFRRFQDAAAGRIRLVTLAPEHDGALPFIEKLTASGVVVSLGHTAATSACIRSAIAAGARLSTHLGNGSHALLPRHDNYLWEQLAADELWASIIGDGHHLPPAVLRCILRVKTPARTILTCDASSLAGLPPGRYHHWDQELEVQLSGRIVVPGTPFLAGSGVFTDACIAYLLSLGEVSLSDAIDMAGARPRQLLGLEARPLQVGAPADLVLFDWQAGSAFTVRGTVLAGDAGGESGVELLLGKFHPATTLTPIRFMQEEVASAGKAHRVNRIFEGHPVTSTSHVNSVSQEGRISEAAMKPDIYFMPPSREGLPPNPPHEMLLEIHEILKAAGYELRYSPESAYVLEQTKKGILEKGITFYTNLVSLREAVLPDNTPREELIDLLRYMVRNIQASTELLIIDPYLFPSNPDPDYIDHFGKVFRSAIGRITRLEIVTQPDRHAATEAAFLNQVMAIKPGVTSRIKYTRIFHDRFWIADGTRGLFVGTSLNGIGRRYAITDYLREEDVREIYARFQALP